MIERNLQCFIFEIKPTLSNVLTRCIGANASTYRCDDVRNGDLRVIPSFAVSTSCASIHVCEP